MDLYDSGDIMQIVMMRIGYQGKRRAIIGFAWQLKEIISAL